jgi:hypothetical protein
MEIKIKCFQYFQSLPWVSRQVNAENRKQSLEQELKEEQKLSNEVKQKEALKKSQRQDQGKGHRPT